ncbi:MAG TPA: Gfo/Idh/MocA family oxidoreductase [Terriglobia bacterium]|nr:Gfo/Idh/MocA family oxidoreductase [Terriglobia bacterium]
MSDRRTFMRQVLGGSTAMAVSGLGSAGRILGANDRVRFGLIGAGGRGQQIFKSAIKAPNTEAVAVADVYTMRLEEAKQIAPGVTTYSDFRRLLDDKSVDAVLIATPQHQHALNFVPAIEAGKDVYQEKTMAFNPDHARRMRHAFVASDRVVQVGIQSTSSQAQVRAHELVHGKAMGRISAIHSHMYRNSPYGGWKRPIPSDCDAQHVEWKAFEGEAALHPFDPNRYMNWRFYWDYSGGNVFENMVHQVGFWFKAMDLHIPERVSMTGANYFSPDMQVPDTMDVTMALPEKIFFSWNSGFGSSFYGADEVVLGSEGAVLRDQNNDTVSYVPRKTRRGGAAGGGEGASSPDIVGGGDETELHMQNFFDCVRSRKAPNCPFEIGYRSAVACQMAIASYRQGREVRWDAEAAQIV